MASFQKTTMSVSIFLLIICLVFIGYSLYNSKYTKQYPPIISDCPDYWKDMSVGDASKCVNDQPNLGNSDCETTMDFSSAVWSGSDGLCKKKQWAKKCNLTWDGVTNNANACS
jgi:hypothetical protein